MNKALGSAFRRVLQCRGTSMYRLRYLLPSVQSGLCRRLSDLSWATGLYHVDNNPQLECTYEADRRRREIILGESECPLEDALTTEQQEKLKEIQTEFQFLSGWSEMPVMNDKHWRMAIGLQREGARVALYEKILKKQKKREKMEADVPMTATQVETTSTQEESTMKEEKPVRDYYDDHPYPYEVFDWTRKVEAACQYRLLKAKMFGCPLIFDMDYESQMSLKGQKLVAAYLHESVLLNQQHAHPFHLVFANARLNENFAEKFLFPTHKSIKRNSSFFDWTEECFTTLYDPSKLVYLTSDSENDLLKFNYKDTYIIGGMQNVGTRTRLSFAKAEQMGIRHARFPLKRFLNMKTRSHVLNFRDVMKVMLDFKYHGSIKKALLDNVSDALPQQPFPYRRGGAKPHRQSSDRFQQLFERLRQPSEKSRQPSEKSRQPSERFQKNWKGV